MPMKPVAPISRRVPSAKTPSTVVEGGNKPVERRTQGQAIVYAVVSRPGGKGKTTTSSALAAYFALSGKATIIGEFDDHARVHIRLVGKQRRNAKPLSLSRTSYALFFPKESAISEQEETYDIRSAPFRIDMEDTLARSGLPEKVIEAVKAERGWQSPNVLDVIPGSPSLKNIDSKFAIKEHEAAEAALTFNPNLQVAKSLAYFREIYDVIVIDTPASLTGLTWNALIAADYVYMPVGFSPDSIEDYDETFRTYEQVVVSAIVYVDRPQN
jgi:cellulose biosynthesis protein BcsQ